MMKYFNNTKHGQTYLKVEESQIFMHVCIHACLSVFCVCVCVRAYVHAPHLCVWICVCMSLSVCVHHAVTFQQQCKADTTCYKGKWVCVCNKGFEDNYQLHSKILA